MRAVVLQRHGGPDVLRPVERPDPRPAAGQVAVRVAAIGMNYAEVLSRKGLYGWAPELPYVLGMEACGEVVEAGDGVDPDRVGERVIVGAKCGCYAERVVVPDRQALPALAQLSVEENAAFAVNFVTAWVGLMEMARLRSDDRVLITAAAGGVGTAAVQIAGAFGCTVVGAVGREAKFDHLKSVGADHAVSYGGGDLAGRVRAATDGPGVDVVLEVVGGDVFRDAMDLLEPFGRLVVLGFAGYELRWWNPLTWWRTWREMPRADIMDLARRSNGVMASHIGYLLGDPERMQRIWRELTDFVGAHDLKPIVGATFDLDEIAEAHRHMESRESIGKIVVRV